MKKQKYFLNAFLIWLWTNVIGAVIYLLICFAQFLLCNDCGDELPFAFIIIILSLLFSTPAIPLLIPMLWPLTVNVPTPVKAIYGFTIVLILCIVIIALCFSLYGVEFRNILSALISIFSPYVFAAEVSFFAVAMKMILNRPSAPKDFSTEMFYES